MNVIEQAIAYLKAEITAKQAALDALKALVVHPPTNVLKVGSGKATAKTKGQRKKREWTDAQRRAQARRVKAIWRAKKKAEKQGRS